MQIAAGQQLASTKVAARSLRSTRVARSAVVVNARAGNWLPGSTAPKWLPESLPATYGFDPLGLAKEPSSLARFTESEIIHSRWAMLGAAGVLAVELFGYGNWYDAPLEALNGGRSTYLGSPVPFDLTTLTAVEFVAFATAESIRNNETNQKKRCYPGIFDPAGLSKDPKAFAEYKVKEIKNGRLAMLACLGFVAQHAATGQTPLTNLKDHISNPWVNNFATNGISLPF